MKQSTWSRSLAVHGVEVLQPRMVEDSLVGIGGHWWAIGEWWAPNKGGDWRAGVATVPDSPAVSQRLSSSYHTYMESIISYHPTKCIS